jgi:hypothetical protein
MNFPNYPELVKNVIRNLRKLSTRMVLFQQNAAHFLGVVHTDFKTADILNETGPLTAGELAKVTGLNYRVLRSRAGLPSPEAVECWQRFWAQLEHLSSAEGVGGPQA